jgi:subtilase family serine protease
MVSKRPGRQTQFYASICVTLLAACSLALVCAPIAAASLSRSAYRAQRLCASAPAPGTASCLGMRLISKSLTAADLHANAVKQSQEAADGATPAVLNKTVPGGFTPSGLHSAYSLPTETPASATQTIGLVDAYNDPTAEADLAVYDKQFGLAACTSSNGCFRKINQSGKTSPLPAKSGEWSAEISLDVQMAHAICQNCHILLVEAANQNWGSFGAAVNAAVNAGATEVSNSYGGPETSSYSTLTSYYDHPGVAVTVSSGDCGYFNQACAGWSEAANFPADAPDVVAVGGTSLSGSGESWSSTDWNEGGSGCSTVFDAQLWQSAASNFSATGCGSRRSVADVSAVGDPHTGVDVYDTTPAANGDNTGWGVWGGTSASSPIIAAEFALAGGARGVEFPAATLYAHLGESSALYDVSSGTNGSCSGASACQANSGYDSPTGVGSPVGLSAFSPVGSPVNESLPTISGVAEQGQTLTASAGGWSGSPTSTTYQWEICNASGALCAAVSGASASSFAVPTNALHLTIRVVVSTANGSGGGTPTASASSGVVVSNVPTISSISPSSGVTGSTVTITGTAFTGATRVKFGSVSATSFTVLSATQIEATVPNGVLAGAINVTTPVKSVTGSAKFTPTLSVTAVSPGRAAPGATVTLKGVGFNSSSAVNFTGAPATSVTFMSSTTLKAVVPVGAKTGIITVTNSAAPTGSTSTAFTFTFA